jgi:hypothetical protein
MSNATSSPEPAGQAVELAHRYLALWNEPEPDRRAAMIVELWTEGGSQVLQPPLEMRAIAAGPGIGMVATLKAQGHAELKRRAASSYEHWVTSQGLSFRGGDDAEQLDDVVKFRWEAFGADGEVMAFGLNVLVLARDGRIERNYTFVES